MYDLPGNLFLAFAVAKNSGLCLAPLHAGRTPGSFYVPRFNETLPFEAFADVASDKAPCHATALPASAPRYEMRAFHTSCSPGVIAQPTRWCPQRAENGRLIRMDVCVSVCSADGNSYRPAGEAIREAAELVAERGSGSRASLTIRLGKGHEKSIARVTHYGKRYRGDIPLRAVGCAADATGDEARLPRYGLGGDGRPVEEQSTPDGHRAVLG